MQHEERQYLETRLKDEELRAAQAVSPEASNIHAQLAELYRRRLAPETARGTWAKGCAR